jgi:hypothetical protein
MNHATPTPVGTMPAASVGSSIHARIGRVGVITAAVIVFALVGFTSPHRAEGAPSRVVPLSSQQLVVGVAPSWDSQHISIHRFQRRSGASSSAWSRVGGAWSGRVGARGLAWGRGLHPAEAPPAVVEKREGDRRAPAGAFRLGTVFGFAPSVPHPPSTPYVQVTNRDLLVEDPSSPLYNTHVRLDHPARTAWERANQMELTDPAHELKIFVHHNTDPVVPGKGSAILLHITRGKSTLTSGCTAMERAAVFELVRWLDASKHPVYVLLTQDVYNSVAMGWGLPSELVLKV